MKCMLRMLKIAFSAQLTLTSFRHFEYSTRLLIAYVAEILPGPTAVGVREIEIHCKMGNMFQSNAVSVSDKSGQLLKEKKNLFSKLHFHFSIQ